MPSNNGSRSSGKAARSSKNKTLRSKGSPAVATSALRDSGSELDTISRDGRGTTSISSQHSSLYQGLMEEVKRPRMQPRVDSIADEDDLPPSLRVAYNSRPVTKSSSKKSQKTYGEQGEIQQARSSKKGIPKLSKPVPRDSMQKNSLKKVSRKKAMPDPLPQPNKQVNSEVSSPEINKNPELAQMLQENPYGGYEPPQTQAFNKPRKTPNPEKVEYKAYRPQASPKTSSIMKKDSDKKRLKGKKVAAGVAGAAALGVGAVAVAKGKSPLPPNDVMSPQSRSPSVTGSAYQSYPNSLSGGARSSEEYDDSPIHSPVARGSPSPSDPGSPYSDDQSPGDSPISHGSPGLSEPGSPYDEDRSPGGYSDFAPESPVVRGSPGISDPGSPYSEDQSFDGHDDSPQDSPLSRVSRGLSEPGSPYSENRSPVESGYERSLVASDVEGSAIESADERSPIGSDRSRSPTESIGERSPIESDVERSPVGSYDGERSLIESDGERSPVESHGERSLIESDGERSPSVASDAERSPSSYQSPLESPRDLPGTMMAGTDGSPVGTPLSYQQSRGFDSSENVSSNKPSAELDRSYPGSPASSDIDDDSSSFGGSEAPLDDRDIAGSEAGESYHGSDAGKQDDLDNQSNAGSIARSWEEGSGSQRDSLEGSTARTLIDNQEFRQPSFEKGDFPRGLGDDPDFGKDSFESIARSLGEKPIPPSFEEGSRSVGGGFGGANFADERGMAGESDQQKPLWKRPKILIIAGVVLIVVILAISLGAVFGSRRRGNSINNNSNGAQSANGIANQEAVPLGGFRNQDPALVNDASAMAGTSMSSVSFSTANRRRQVSSTGDSPTTFLNFYQHSNGEIRLSLFQNNQFEPSSLVATNARMGTPITAYLKDGNFRFAVFYFDQDKILQEVRSRDGIQWTAGTIGELRLTSNAPSDLAVEYVGSCQGLRSGWLAYHTGQNDIANLLFWNEENDQWTESGGIPGVRQGAGFTSQADEDAWRFYYVSSQNSQLSQMVCPRCCANGGPPTWTPGINGPPVTSATGGITVVNAGEPRLIYYQDADGTVRELNNTGRYPNESYVMNVSSDQNGNTGQLMPNNGPAGPVGAPVWKVAPESKMGVAGGFVDQIPQIWLFGQLGGPDVSMVRRNLDAAGQWSAPVPVPVART